MSITRLSPINYRYQKKKFQKVGGEIGDYNTERMKTEYKGMQWNRPLEGKLWIPEENIGDLTYRF